MQTNAQYCLACAELNLYKLALLDLFRSAAFCGLFFIDSAVNYTFDDIKAKST